MLVLKNATVVEFQPPSVRSGVDIVIDGPQIVAVGAGIAANYRADRVLDLVGAVVTPGLVCSHNHFYSGLARGMHAQVDAAADSRRDIALIPDVASDPLYVPVFLKIVPIILDAFLVVFE